MDSGRVVRNHHGVDLAAGLQTFVRVAEAGSFTRAARSLGVTPSGVGKTLARLEAELGVRLLARTTRRVTLTEDGELFFEQCRKILDDLENARSFLSSRRAAARGRLRVTVPATIGRRFLVPALAKFVAAHPEVKLELVLTDRLVNLVEEHVDVAIRIGALADSSLVARKIGAQQVITIAAPQLLRGRRVHAPVDLAAVPAVVFRRPSSGTVRPWTFSDRGHVATIHPRATISIDDGEAMVAAVRAGLGVAQVPHYMAEAELAAGQVVEVLPSFRPPTEPIFAVHLHQRIVPPRTRAFLDFCARRSVSFGQA